MMSVRSSRLRASSSARFMPSILTTCSTIMSRLGIIITRRIPRVDVAKPSSAPRGVLVYTAFAMTFSAGILKVSSSRAVSKRTM